MCISTQRAQHGTINSVQIVKMASFFFKRNVLKILAEYDDVHILCGGDFNARTGNKSDFVEDDIIEYTENHNYLSSDYISDYFNLRRFSLDKTVNNFGKCLTDLCSVLNIHIMNGRCGSDKNVGDYTFIGRNGTSVIDYIIASFSLFDNVVDFDVESRSDSVHLPVTMKLRVPDLNQPPPQRNIQSNTSFKFVWDNDKLQSFKDKFFSDQVQDLLDKSVNTALSDIDLCIDYLVDALKLAGSHMQKKVGSPRPNQECKWYDAECEKLKTKRCRAHSINSGDVKILILSVNIITLETNIQLFAKKKGKNTSKKNKKC